MLLYLPLTLVLVTLRVAQARLPKMMRACVSNSPGSSSLTLIERPEIAKPHDCIVKILATGVCHTDLHVIDDDWPIKAQRPFVPGHEGIGEIVKIGTESVCGVGDIVGVPWLHSTCGSCEYCIGGNENYCQSAQYTGFSVNGCFAEYILADSRFVTPIPPSLSVEQAAPICCAGVTTYRGIKETFVKPGQWLGIFGAAGGLGHLGVQLGNAMGCKCVAVVRGPTQVQIVQSWEGNARPTMIVDSTKSSMTEDVISTTQGGCHGLFLPLFETYDYHHCYQLSYILKCNYLGQLTANHRSNKHGSQ